MLAERIERSFRISKHDLQARPIYQNTRESIEAHVTSVFAALAVSHWIEHRTGWSIKKFVRTARRYRTVTIQAGRQILTAAEPIPDDLAEALTKINAPTAAHWPDKSRVGSRIRGLVSVIVDTTPCVSGSPRQVAGSAAYLTVGIEYRTHRAAATMHSNTGQA